MLFWWETSYLIVVALVTAQLDTGLQSNTTLAEHGTTTTNTINANTAQFDDKSVISKMTEFHQHMDSLHFTKCQVCEDYIHSKQLISHFTFQASPMMFLASA